METSPPTLSRSPREQRKRKHNQYESISEPQNQVPSPSPSKVEQRISFESESSSAENPDTTSRKRVRLYTDGARAEGKLAWWLSQDSDFQERSPAAASENMSRPPSKRSRPSDTSGEPLSLSGDGSDTSLSRGRKYTLYQSSNYPVVLETKGSYMRASDLGMVEQDWGLCKSLLTSAQEIEADTLFDLHFDTFHANLRGRSEARICTDLHPRLAPSVENLFIAGRTNLRAFVEGYNDPWLKAIPFYGPRPQPDHTYGFKWDSFSETQRRKMGIDPQQKSLYTARENIYFPFLTAEVKCGRQGLDLAERPNMHSMTVAIRGIVDLYRRVDRSSELHRRVLGFTISHDDATERIHAYYPEINGDETTYWRKVIKEFALSSQDDDHRWTSYRFTLNVCEMFALPLLDRLKHVIDELPDPLSQSVELSSNLGDFSVQSSQEDTSRDGTLRRFSSAGGLGVGLRNMIQSLQQQLEEQQKKEEEQQRRFKEQEEKLERLMRMLEEQKK